MADAFPKIQKRALVWLINRGGDGAMSTLSRERYRCVLAQGEICDVRINVWRSLVEYGCCEFYDRDTRIRVTPEGYKEKLSGIEEAPSRVTEDNNGEDV